MLAIVIAVGAFQVVQEAGGVDQLRTRGRRACRVRPRGRPPRRRRPRLRGASGRAASPAATPPRRQPPPTYEAPPASEPGGASEAAAGTAATRRSGRPSAIGRPTNEVRARRGGQRRGARLPLQLLAKRRRRRLPFEQRVNRRRTRSSRMPHLRGADRREAQRPLAGTESSCSSPRRCSSSTCS